MFDFALLQGVLKNVWEAVTAPNKYVKKDSLQRSEEIAGFGPLFGTGGPQLLKTDSNRSERTAGGSDTIRDAMAADQPWYSVFRARKKPSKPFLLQRQRARHISFV